MTKTTKPSLRRVLGFGLGLLFVLGALITMLFSAIRSGDDSSMARIHADFAVVLDALERYRAARSVLPEEGDLSFLVPDYLPAMPVDPWGRPYQYAYNGRQLFLSTLGQDGLRGGVGADQDHNNHDGHVR